MIKKALNGWPWIVAGVAAYAAAGIAVKYSATGTSQGLFNPSDIAMWPYLWISGTGWTIKPGVLAGGS